MNVRVTIQWTETARAALAALPLKVRKGLLDKADELYHGGDPRQRHKPLQGPLQGCYRITYARYRAVYLVEEERDAASGEVVLHLRVLFIAAGVRRERDKNDIYKVAEKLVKFLMPDESKPATPPTKPKPKKKP